MIALNVSVELGLPKISVPPGVGAVDRTAMPEAAVDKDRGPRPRERNIRPNPQSLDIDPIILPKTCSSHVQKGTKSNLWNRIRAPIGHHRAANRWRTSPGGGMRRIRSDRTHKVAREGGLGTILTITCSRILGIMAAYVRLPPERVPKGSAAIDDGDSNNGK